jgi:2-polyprenyl-3-methyl-5-hydroxy-6-metoxy-1,4-benzoquinol methylase
VRYGAAVDVDLSHRVDEVPERFVPDEMHGDLVEAEHLARYWWAASLADGRRVLDAGCGMGYGTNLLAAAGATQSVGVDVAESVIEVASTSAGERVSFTAADVRQLPFDDGTFDLVVCFEVIEHIEDQDQVLDELARVLAPHGVLAVSSPNPDAYVPGNPHHVRELRPEELRELVAKRFEHVEVFAQANWISSVVVQPARIASPRLAAIPELQAATVTEPDPGGAPYAVALASRKALPIPVTRLVATGLAEPRRWLELFSEQQELLTRQHRHIDGIADQAAELRELHDQLRRSEAEIARLTGVEALLLNAQERLETMRGEQMSELIAVHDELNAVTAQRDRSAAVLRAVFASPSWRITAPLRRLKGLLR